MTMPSERTRALVWAAEFLQELRRGSDTPAAIREQAIRVLRHFPEARSIEQEAERQMRRHQEATKDAWLLPVEPSDATHPLTDLKGMFGKPKKTVSIEEMNAAIAAAAARAGRCP